MMMTHSNFKLILICNVINALGGQYATKLMVSYLPWLIGGDILFYVQSRVCFFM